LARLVRFHHHPWQNGRGEEHNGKAVPQLAHILHLADRIAVQIDFHQEVLNQKNEIIETIARGTGEKFIPEHVEALRFVAEKEAFWFDLTSPEIDGIIQDRLPLGELTLNCDQLPELAQLFRKIIDFRSRFTATHSSGVAAVGVLLAKKSGWDGDGCCEEMELAGLLHDVGKLVVPSEILNKHTPLIDEDFAIIRKHPYYSAWVLRNLGGFGEVSRWVALHHERLDGSGYPYRQSEEKLPEGAKILAVADTFTALMEDRPYRCGMSALGTGKVMRNMAVHRKLDQHYVTLIHDCREEFDEVRFQAQQAADSEHQSFMAECCLLDADLLPEDYCPAGSGAD
jgi:HD-GYP domain-containing protein (c-di-GMP phosphodiesterase class II)